MYLTAKERVIEAGFADEIDWQEGVSLDDLDEPTFLRESAWVVLSAGFRETVLRHRFGQISRAFLYWDSADLIIAQRETCRTNALVAFGNQRKINAVLEIVERVAGTGIDTIRRQIISRSTEFLEELPFIGPVTACHLAKNLGMPMVKSDRHLRRLATKTGYESAGRMCRVISELVGDSLSVIDVVLWRCATIKHGESVCPFAKNALEFTYIPD
jgi:hypothetical protein